MEEQCAMWDGWHTRRVDGPQAKVADVNDIVVLHHGVWRRKLWDDQAKDL